MKVKELLEKIGCITSRKLENKMMNDFFGDLSPNSEHRERKMEPRKSLESNNAATEVQPYNEEYNDGYDGYDQDEMDEFDELNDEKSRRETQSNGSLSRNGASRRSGNSAASASPSSWSGKSISGRSGRTTRSGKSSSARSRKSAYSVNMAGSLGSIGTIGSKSQTERVRNVYSPRSPTPPQMNIYIQRENSRSSFQAPISSVSLTHLNDNILDSPPPTAKKDSTTNSADNIASPEEKMNMLVRTISVENTPANAAEILANSRKKDALTNGKKDPSTTSKTQNGESSPTKRHSRNLSSKRKESKNKGAVTTTAEQTKKRTSSKRQNGTTKPVEKNISISTPPPLPFSSFTKGHGDENDRYADLLISPLTAPTMAVKIPVPQGPRVLKDDDFSVAPSLEVQKRSIITVSKKYDTNSTGTKSNGINSRMTETSSSEENRVTTSIAFDDIYERGKQLGFGAFANVFLATHKPTGAKYAVKEVDRTCMVWNDKDHLQQEIDNMFKVREGPNIVQLYEVYSNNEDVEDDETEEESAAMSSEIQNSEASSRRRRRRRGKKKNLCHLVVELMEGGELFDRIIEKRTFTEREARDSIRCVLEALKYMHDRRVVHRDLKPENLLLKLRDKTKLTPVKLADFGFAKSIKSKNGCRSLCGTPGYLAPEILERFPSYDVQCDIWSVGAILFLLLGGYLPFDDDNEEKVFDRTRNADYDFNPRCWRNISFGAKDLISSCLTIDPRKRFTARDCLNHSWMANKEVARNVQLETDELQAARAKGRRKMRAAVKTVSRFHYLCSHLLFR